MTTTKAWSWRLPTAGAATGTTGATAVAMAWRACGERVSWLGGELSAGPRAGGGYRLVARDRVVHNAGHGQDPLAHLPVLGSRGGPGESRPGPPGAVTPSAEIRGDFEVGVQCIWATWARSLKGTGRAVFT